MVNQKHTHTHASPHFTAELHVTGIIETAYTDGICIILLYYEMFFRPVHLPSLGADVLSPGYNISNEFIIHPMYVRLHIII